MDSIRNFRKQEELLSQVRYNGLGCMCRVRRKKDIISATTGHVREFWTCDTQRLQTLGRILGESRILSV